MSDLAEVIQSILTNPTPQALVALQGALLISGRQDAATDSALAIAGHFYSYLCDLQSKIAARDYSELASRLDIGAVGAVAMESVVTGERDKFWTRLLLGSVGESLMVAASRQYVKAWEVETGLSHISAAWYLTGALWHASSEMQPDQPPDERWQAIQALLAPAHDPEVSGPEKALLLGRIFQMLLLTHLARVMTAES